MTSTKVKTSWLGVTNTGFKNSQSNWGTLLVVKVSLAPAKLESVTIGDSAANPKLDTWGVD